jgi:hypothetical protein
MLAQIKYNAYGSPFLERIVESKKIDFFQSWSFPSWEWIANLFLGGFMVRKQTSIVQ